LKLVELDSARRQIKTYSGHAAETGLAQARQRSDLLILDEPTSGLDQQAGKGKYQRLKNEGKTVFFSSHELEVETVCDRCRLIRRAEAEGKVDELMRLYQRDTLEQVFLKIVVIMKSSPNPCPAALPDLPARSAPWSTSLPWLASC
jgi:ABC-2 type transport system ATP-binding protein